MEINEKNKKKEQQALIIRKYRQYLKLEKSLSPNTLDAYLTDLDKLMSFLEHKPRGLEIIMTGHEVSDRIIRASDYVTEMKKVKHPYDKGQSAREGIEY